MTSATGFDKQKLDRRIVRGVDHLPELLKCLPSAVRECWRVGPVNETFGAKPGSHNILPGCLTPKDAFELFARDRGALRAHGTTLALKPEFFVDLASQTRC